MNIRFKNNGLLIESDRKSLFICGPKKRIVYVNKKTYQLSFPFLVFAYSYFYKVLYCFAYEKNPIQDGKIYLKHPENMPYSLPLPNMENTGSICLGSKRYANIFEAINIFWTSDFDSDEWEPIFPKSIKCRFVDVLMNDMIDKQTMIYEDLKLDVVEMNLNFRHLSTIELQ